MYGLERDTWKIFRSIAVMVFKSLNVTFHRKTGLIENSVFGAFETPHKRDLTAFQTLRKLVWNALQTLRKLLTNAWKAFQTLFKPFANAGQTVCKSCQMLLKLFANAFQITLCKRFANPLQTLRKPFANASLEGPRNQSARNKTGLAMQKFNLEHYNYNVPS